jgi:hypothetical protein
MDWGDLKIVFYVVIGIIYLVYQVSQKKKEALPNKTSRPAQNTGKQAFPNTYNTPGTPEKAPYGTSPIPKGIPSSLEDFLAEFNIEVEKPKPVEGKKVVLEKSYSPTYIDYEENMVDENELARKKIANDIRAAADLKKDRVALADEHFTPYSIKTKSTNEYVEMLKNASSVKKAFVMAEILKRKYS